MVKAHCEFHREHNEDCYRCKQREGIAMLARRDDFERDAPLGRNGGRACDTRSGPCSCGAWH